MKWNELPTTPLQCKRWDITKNLEFPLYFSMIFAPSTPLKVPPSANAQLVDTDRTLLETVTRCDLGMLQPSGTFPGTLWTTPSSSFSEEFCLAWCEAVITLILSTLIASFLAPIIIHPVTISHLPYIKFPNMCGSICGTSVVLIDLSSPGPVWLNIITKALCKCLDIWLRSTSYFAFCRGLLTIPGPLLFHINYRISLSSSVKNSVKILIGISGNY